MKTIRCTGCGSSEPHWEDNWGGHHDPRCTVTYTVSKFDGWFERFKEMGACDEEAAREADDRATRGEIP